jgi:transcriptional regulator with XRE-family HTH domain
MRPSDLAAAVAVRDGLRSGAARSARVAAGISGADMARVLRVSPAAVFWWETGRNTPSVAHALAYGRALAAVTRQAA